MIKREFVGERRLDASQSFALVHQAVKERQPFSFVRMNDGEAIVLGAFREVSDKQLAKRLKHWWGEKSFSPEQIEDLRKYLLTAAASSDLLGFFDEGDGKPEAYEVCGQLLRRYAALRPDQRFCSPEVHYDWHSQDRLKTLFQSVEDVVVVSCYDLREGMQQKFGFKTIDWIEIPGHSRYAYKGVGENSHYPQRFDVVCERLAKLPKQSIVIVGAGVVGKFYCHTVKQADGVALDLGSVFDFWARNIQRTSVAKGASRMGF